jgi:hypothetical protein
VAATCRHAGAGPDLGWQGSGSEATRPGSEKPGPRRRGPGFCVCGKCWRRAERLARGRPERTAGALRRVLGSAAGAGERVPALALLARAAAAADDARLYEEAWSAAWTLATADPPEAHAGALLELAHAAEARGDWLRVQQAARLVSEEVEEAAEKRLARALLERLAAARRPSPGAPDSAPPTPARG